MTKPLDSTPTTCNIKESVEIINDLQQISSNLPTELSSISNITQIGTLITSISTITGYKPIQILILFVLYKIISLIYLKKIIKKKYNDDKSIESLSIIIKNLPLTTTATSNISLQFQEYLAIVYYLKLKNIQYTSYVADYNAKFIYLDNLSNIKINDLITFTSTYSNNGSNINCSLILSSTNITILKKFIDNCKKIYKKHLEYN
jgi:hypothetical protein